MIEPHPDLLPCPFCGERRIFLNEPADPRRRGGSINCPACLVVMPGEVNRDELIACWNIRASGWQDIETAPKDGSWILIPDRRYESGRTVMARWDDQKYGRRPVPYWSFIDERVHGIGASRANQPTQWQPLPAPPVAEDEA